MASGLYIFTASNSAAKDHIRDTIDNAIPSGKVEKYFSEPDLNKIQEIGRKHGYYAWGATPGAQNITRWGSMNAGDHVLVYQDKTYTYYSKVVYKIHHPEMAVEFWGKDPEGNTWEYIYFLEKPNKFAKPIESISLSKHLPSQYMGFSKIAVEKVQDIINNYGSLDNFINKEFMKKEELKAIPNFWWVCQGLSYTPDQGQRFLWAPSSNPPSEVVQQHWKNVGLVQPGDITFNYSDSHVRGVSLVKSKVYEQDGLWGRVQRMGKKVDIDHYAIEPLNINKLRIKKDKFVAALGETVGPFDVNGEVKQGYLYPFNFESAKIVREIYGKPFPKPIENYFIGMHPPVVKIIEKDIFNELLKKKKQIILYGPPGTGKTFHTKSIAVKILKETGHGKIN